MGKIHLSHINYHACMTLGLRLFCHKIFLEKCFSYFPMFCATENNSQTVNKKKQT